MKQTVLISWIGLQDDLRLLLSQDASVPTDGWWESPLGKILHGRSPDQILLLSTHPSLQSVEGVGPAIKNLCPEVQDIKLFPLQVDGVCIHDLEWCLDQLRSACLGLDETWTLLCNCQSGTPAMITAMLWLGSTTKLKPLMLRTEVVDEPDQVKVGSYLRSVGNLELSDRKQARPIPSSHARVAPAPGAPYWQWRSPAMVELLENARQVAGSFEPIMLLGEPGTGKSTIAQQIHAWSRRSGRCVTVNCAIFGADRTKAESDLFGHVPGAYTGASATKERSGLFEAADHGTLFLDEIATIDLHTQALVLRVLEERRYHRMGANWMDAKFERENTARLIVATNEDPTDPTKFRQDLFDRVAGAIFTVPPLRSLREDIPELAARFLPDRCRFSDDAVTVLYEHDWPGNIRELGVVLRLAGHVAATSTGDGIITGSMIRTIIERRKIAVSRPSGRPTPFEVGLDKWLEEAEREWAHQALERSGGNQTEAARILGMGPGYRNKLRLLMVWRD